MVRLLVTTLLLNIPTCTLLLYGGLGCKGSFVSVRRLLLSGALAGVLLTLFRSLPWPFGMHFPLIALAQVLLIQYLSRGSWGLSVLATMVTNIAVALGEGLIAVPIMGMLGISLKQSLESPEFTLLGGWLANSVLVLLCIVVFYRRRGGQHTAIT